MQQDGTTMHSSLTTPEEIKQWCSAYNLPCEVSEAIKLKKAKGIVFDRLAGLQTNNGHWNFCYTSPSGKEIIAYDPFGIPYYVPEFKDKIVIYSLDQDQKLNERSCGLYCFLFAFRLFNNILKIKNYMIVDFKNKKWYISSPDVDKDKYKKYEKIYESLHK